MWPLGWAISASGFLDHVHGIWGSRLVLVACLWVTRGRSGGTGVCDDGCPRHFCSDLLTCALLSLPEILQGQSIVMSLLFFLS